MTVKSDQQLKSNDCGISAVKSIFNFYNINIERDYIASRISLDSNGAYLNDIKLFFELHNFEAGYNFLDLNTLKFDTEKIKNYLPCILPVKSSTGLHYVVIYGVEGKKLLVMDPAEAGSLTWNFSEFMRRANSSVVYYDKMSSKQVLQQLIKDELKKYNFRPEGNLPQDESTMANKLTYFSYLKENYGFSSAESEAKFLRDLVYRLELSAVPNEFKALTTDNEKLSIKTPVVLTVKPTGTIYIANSPQKDKRKTGSYRKLFREMHQFRKIWYIYIVAALVAALVTQLLVFSSQLLIDDILPGYDTGLVILFAAGLGIFRCFELLLRVYKNFISIQLANIFDTHFLISFIRKLNSFPIRYIHSFNRGDLTERMKDSLALKTFFTRFFTSVLTDTAVSFYSLIILFIISWKISLIILAIMIAFVVWFKIITPRIRENENRRFIQKSGLFSAALENIDGLQTIKSFNLEHVFQQRIQPSVSGMLRVQKRVRYINLLNSTVIDFIVIIAGILILVTLSQSSMIKHDITPGQIITFIALSSRIFYSLVNIMDENLDLQENEIILKRYLDFDAAQQAGTKETAVQQNENSIKKFTIKSIRFENIGFEYIPQKPVLRDFNFIIAAAEKVLLEGSNGTGKSTFCKILSMLYPPCTGNIFINDEKAVFYNESALRKKVLLVSNDDVLFNDTLAFNISFNRNNDAKKILELSRQIGFHDFISKNAEGLDFLITEQGRNLSTGQRKKILLLRAFLSDAELIIIDEVLSGVDKESKEKIEAYINKSDRAFIVISHEPVENIRFDKILQLKNGVVSEITNTVEDENQDFRQAFSPKMF